jgi:hypothetical protein
MEPSSMSYTSIVLTPSVAANASARLGHRLRGRLAVIAAAATLLVVWAGLLATHTTPRLPVNRAVALHAILKDPGLRRMLTRAHWQRVDSTPLDSRFEELGFYRGARMVATVTVGRGARGLIIDATDLTREKYAYGSNIANDLRVLGGLAVVFILMTTVWPLWRLRNLDALVAAGTVLSIVLFNRWTLGRMVLFSYPAMIYLALRCACQALAPPGCRLPATPLYDHLTRRWPVEQRVRVLRMALGVLALITLMVGLTSLHVLDVGYAVMEGGTQLVHGVLPYGHIPDILHGDTYPIASYLLYAPLAALWPVTSSWDNADPTLFVAVGAALLLAWAVSRRAGGLRPSVAGPQSSIGGAEPPPTAGAPSSPTAGLRAAIAVLAFPPLLVTVSTGTTDVVLAAMLALAWLLWRRPGWAMGALSGAAWFKAAPALLVPLLLASHRGRAAVRAVAALVVVSALMIVALVGIGGPSAITEMVSGMAFQFTRGSPHTLWALVGNLPFQPLAEALTLALVAGATVRLRRDPTLAHDPHRVAALIGAVLLGIQISANYWNYMYLVWTLPFLILGLFAEPRRWENAPGGEVRSRGEPAR